MFPDSAAERVSGRYQTISICNTGLCEIVCWQNALRPAGESGEMVISTQHRKRIAIPRSSMSNRQRKVSALTVLSACLLGLAACGDALLEQRVLRGQTMGTTFSIKLVAAPPDLDARDLQLEVEAELQTIEQTMSTYLTASELSRLNNNRSTGDIEVSAALCSVIDAALALSRYTKGAFDITVGPLVNAWGFGPEGSVDKPPARARIERLQHSTGYTHLAADCSTPSIRKQKPDLYLDLSGYAKGYAVDQLARILDARGLSNYIVEVGGELKMRGHNASREPWAIAIERPSQDGQPVQSVVRLTDLAVATSGDYRNYFEHDGVRYSHTIDPMTGSPVTHEVASVTVIADSAAYADAIATALLVLGPVDGLAFAERENIAAYFLMQADEGIAATMTSRFTDEVLP